MGKFLTEKYQNGAKSSFVRSLLHMHTVSDPDNPNFVSVAAMTATNGVSNGESQPDAGHIAAPQPEKGSWTIGLINSR
jgi:hypothetical protein